MTEYRPALIPMDQLTDATQAGVSLALQDRTIEPPTVNHALSEPFAIIIGRMDP